MSAISQTALQQLRELEDAGDPTLISDLVGMFLTSVPDQLNALEEAIRAGNAKGLAAIAHPLKSSSATLGALALSAVFSELESKGRTNVVGTDDLLLISKARTLFAEAVLELQMLLKSR